MVCSQQPAANQGPQSCSQRDTDPVASPSQLGREFLPREPPDLSAFRHHVLNLESLSRDPGQAVPWLQTPQDCESMNKCVCAQQQTASASRLNLINLGVAKVPTVVVCLSRFTTL